MANVLNGIATLREISIASVGCTNRNVTDRQTTDRRTGDDIANLLKIGLFVLSALLIILYLVYLST